MTYNKNANNNQRKNTDISNSNRIRNQDLSNDTEINLYEQKMSENVSKNTHHKLSDSNHNGEHNRDKSNSRNNQNDYYTKPQYNNMAAHFPKEKSNEQLKIIKVNKNIKNNFYVKNILSKWKKVKILVGYYICFFSYLFWDIFEFILYFYTDIFEIVSIS